MPCTSITIECCCGFMLVFVDSGVFDCPVCLFFRIYICMYSMFKSCYFSKFCLGRTFQLFSLLSFFFWSCVGLEGWRACRCWLPSLLLSFTLSTVV